MIRAAAIVLAACNMIVWSLLCNTSRSAAAANAPRFLAFAFATDSHGWAAGGLGIDVTNDGGRTWQVQYRGERVDELTIVKRRSVYALSAGGVLHTADDGAHWTVVARPQPALRTLAFATERSGFAVASDGLLYATDDGARTWHRAAFGKPVDAVCFSDKRSGYAGGATTAPALGAFDGIATSADGGRSWRAAARPPSDGLVGIAGHTLHCTRGSVYDLIDLGAHAGGGAYLLARSTDGARSWTTLATGGQVPRLHGVPQGPGSEATSMSAYSPDAAYVAGFCGACGEAGQSSFGATLDAGRSWHNVTLPNVGFSSAPVFVSAEHGWIGARVLSRDSPPRTDEVLETHDGGLHWKAVYTTP